MHVMPGAISCTRKSISDHLYSVSMLGLCTTSRSFYFQGRAVLCCRRLATQTPVNLRQLYKQSMACHPGEQSWYDQRAAWLSKPDVPEDAQAEGAPCLQHAIPNLDVTSVENVLRCPARAAPLPCVVPLRQLVCILVEMWEDEGVFD